MKAGNEKAVRTVKSPNAPQFEADADLFYSLHFEES